MAFNIILDALTLAMQRLESLSDLSVRLQRLEHLDSALKKPVADGIDDRCRFAIFGPVVEVKGLWKSKVFMCFTVFWVGLYCFCSSCVQVCVFVCRWVL